MNTTLRLATAEEVAAWEAEPPQKQRRWQAQCTCGRFAKYLGIRYWYNGSYTCETMTVECSRCGTVGVELV
jgi:hypothetical protein